MCQQTVCGNVFDTQRSAYVMNSFDVGQTNLLLYKPAIINSDKWFHRRQP